MLSPDDMVRASSPQTPRQGTDGARRLALSPKEELLQGKLNAARRSLLFQMAVHISQPPDQQAGASSALSADSLSSTLQSVLDAQQQLENERMELLDELDDNEGGEYDDGVLPRAMGGALFRHEVATYFWIQLALGRAVATWLVDARSSTRRARLDAMASASFSIIAHMRLMRGWVLWARTALDHRRLRSDGVPSLSTLQLEAQPDPKPDAAAVRPPATCQQRLVNELRAMPMAIVDRCDEQYRAKISRFQEVCPQLAAKLEEFLLVHWWTDRRGSAAASNIGGAGGLTAAAVAAAARRVTATACDVCAQRLRSIADALAEEEHKPHPPPKPP